MIKNIVFDMGNVLLAYTPQDYIKTITKDTVIGEAVLKELFYSKEWKDLDGGFITEEKAIELVSFRIPKYSKYVKKSMDNWHTILTPIEGMTEIVTKLKDKGYKIYLLSNTSMRFFKYKDKVEMFKLFDGFVISSEEKLLKPNKEIFECLCNRYNIEPRECIFIDDLQENIDGAIKYGLQGHLFSGFKELSLFLETENILL